MSAIRTTRRVTMAGALALALLISSGGAAGAHTAGKNWPSYVGFTSTETLADDNVTDGHCVYATYIKNGLVFTNGAKSCGPVVYKTHGASVTFAVPCITGHWSC